VRTCFTSKWRLFRGSSVLTLGRYVRCPAGQPHFPLWHNLGSRDWTSDERDPWPALGEYNGSRQYYSGMPPEPFPLPIYFGNDDCFAMGETGTPPPRTFINGFDCRCYAPDLLLNTPTVAPLVGLGNRATLATLATIQAELYGDAASAAILLQAFMGPNSVVSFVADSPTSPYSGSLIGISPTQTIVMSSGTTNQQQYAFQLLYGALGPTDYSTYSTNAQWFANAQVLNDRMVAAGVDLSKPITLVGHSYGGATVTVLAAQILQANPTAELQLFTTGSPRAGDQRLYDIVETRPNVNVISAGDPVASVPPVGAELYPFALVAPAPLYAQWATIAKPRVTWIIDDQGNMVQGDNYILSYASIYNAVSAAIALDPQPLYANHLSIYYRAQLDKPLP